MYNQSSQLRYLNNTLQPTGRKGYVPLKRNIISVWVLADHGVCWLFFTRDWARFLRSSALECQLVEVNTKLTASFTSNLQRLERGSVQWRAPSWGLSSSSSRRRPPLRCWALACRWRARAAPHRRLQPANSAAITKVTHATWWFLKLVEWTVT